MDESCSEVSWWQKITTNNWRLSFRMHFKSIVCCHQTGWHKQMETKSQTAEELKNKWNQAPPLLFAIIFPSSIAICVFLKFHTSIFYSLISSAFPLKKAKKLQAPVWRDTPAQAIETASGSNSHIFILSWTTVYCNPSPISHQRPLDVTSKKSLVVSLKSLRFIKYLLVTVGKVAGHRKVI